MHLVVLWQEAENPQEEHPKSTLKGLHQEIDHLTFLLWESTVCVVLPSRDAKPNYPPEADPQERSVLLQTKRVIQKRQMKLYYFCWKDLI